MSLGDGVSEALDGQGVFRAAVDVGLMGADGVGADDHPFQQCVGIAFQDAAIHKGPWVAFVSVAYRVLGRSFGQAGKLPLQARGEARSSTTTQSGTLNLVNDFVGRHLTEDFAKSSVATSDDVLLDALGINQATVTQDDAKLFTVKRDVLIMRDGLVGMGFHIGETFENSSLDQRLLDQFGDVGRLHKTVKDAFRIDDYHRPHDTEATTASFNYPHFVLQTTALDLGH